MSSIVQKQAGGKRPQRNGRAAEVATDEFSDRLRSTQELSKVVFDSNVALDFRDLQLKPDHERRPFWVTPNGRIFLEASSQLYEAARDFLVAICEPVSRPDFIHEYRLDKNSLFAAASMGMSADIIIASLKRMSKAPVDAGVQEFISACTSGYGKVKLVLKRGRYFIESSYPAVLRLLNKHPVVRKARVRMLPDGTRVVGLDTPATAGRAVVADYEEGFVVDQELVENEASLGLKALVGEGGGGSGGAAAARPEASGEVNSDDEDTAAMARAYASATAAGGAGAGAGKGATSSSEGGGAAAPSGANIAESWDDLSPEAIEDMLAAVDTAISDYHSAKARSAAVAKPEVDASAAGGGRGKGSSKSVSFLADAATLGYDASAAAHRRTASARAVAGTGAGGSNNGRTPGLIGGLDGPRGKSLLEKQASAASDAMGEEGPKKNALTGAALAEHLLSTAAALAAGQPPPLPPAAKPRLRFKLSGTAAAKADAKAEEIEAKVERAVASVSADPQPVPDVELVEENPTAPAAAPLPSVSEARRDFVTRAGTKYADAEVKVARGPQTAGAGAGAGAGDEGEEDYRDMLEVDGDFVFDADALAADAEAEAAAEGGVEEDDKVIGDDGFVRRGRKSGRRGARSNTTGGYGRGGWRGRGRGGTGGSKRGREDGEEGGVMDEEERADAAFEAERAAKRARKEAAEALGDGLDAFREEAAALDDSLHTLHTPGRVEAFEIDSAHVETIRYVCSHMDPPLPLMQEYDHSADTAGVPPLLGADKKPVLLRDPAALRPYQKKSLAKIFGNGRARSGIIVLPCGAGKTLVGIAACVTVGKSCVVLCPNAMSVTQWEDQFVRYSTLPRDSIVKLTSKHKSTVPPRHTACVLITTYTMMAASRRSRESEAMMRELSAREWGLQLLDEVHLAVAEKYSLALKLRCHTRLGLTATLVREDAREVNLAHMIGPKLYEANWMDLTRAGFLANVQCTEVWCPMAPEFYREYCRAKGEHSRMALACCNPVKCWAMDFLLKFHEGRGDKVIIFSESIFAIQLYAAQYQGIVIAGSTPQREREAYIHAFRSTDTVNKLFLSRVGDMALDVPDANVIIQISAHYGSRLQEAQRMGRILRRGTRDNSASGNNAYFYSLVSTDTREMADATRRRRYLVDQGYAYKVVEAVPGLTPTMDALAARSSFQRTPAQRLAVLESVLRENLEELELRESGHLEELDAAPEEEKEEGGPGGKDGEEAAKGPSARRTLERVEGGGSGVLLPSSKLAGAGGGDGGGLGSRLAALSGGQGRRYIEYASDVTGGQALAVSEAAKAADAREAARQAKPPLGPP